MNAGNQFAFDLYAELKDEEGNKFFSPYSIFSALSMTYAGAAGITEEGTEAAAATAVIMTDSAPWTFVADHPFIFLIRDNVTGSILFMGRVSDPSARAGCLRPSTPRGVCDRIRRQLLTIHVRVRARARISSASIRWV